MFAASRFRFSPEVVRGPDLSLWPARCAARSFSSIKRRNSFDRTRTGNRKLGLHEIQRPPSRDDGKKFIAGIVTWITKTSHGPCHFKRHKHGRAEIQRPLADEIAA
jgi:hypothetical protein